jgi:RNA polymerase sigma factor (sigma-70 family)
VIAVRTVKVLVRRKEARRVTVFTNLRVGGVHHQIRLGNVRMTSAPFAFADADKARLFERLKEKWPGGLGTAKIRIDWHDADVKLASLVEKIRAGGGLVAAPPGRNRVMLNNPLSVDGDPLDEQAFTERLLAIRKSLARRAEILTASVSLPRGREYYSPDDLVADTIERVLRVRHRFQAGTDMLAWAGTIMRHRLIDHARRPAKYVLIGQAALDELPEDPSISEPASEWASISPQALRRAIKRLPPPHRKVFELRVLKKRSYGDIAASLGVAIGTVATRLLRARCRLREILVGSAAPP